jgi:class 3 adenylate cyclase
MGEIETVTVLFTGLVDSTGLLTRHGPAAMDRLRQAHFTLLRRAVGAAGREVKNLGDGLMVVFASASTGVEVAVAMQQAVARTQSPDGQPIGLRVGLAVGDADADADDDFGAARRGGGAAVRASRRRRDPDDGDGAGAGRRRSARRPGRCRHPLRPGRTER